ncbi:general transcription factor 3C polypeptide 2 [Paramormyrops kingsleyae]|uniref:general transcription factor 3C polypeptide 2 n=1 Tax=Paramormyrops kingsleyae TaxID=1676925 RepID=UPI003B9721B4
MASAVQEEGRQGEEVQGVCQDQTGCQEGSQSHVHNDTELLGDSGSGDPGGVKNGEDAPDTGQDEQSSCQTLDSTQSLSESSNSHTPNNRVRRRVGRPRKHPEPGRPPASSVPSMPPPSTSSEKNEELTPKTQKKRGRKSKVELLAMALEKERERQEAGVPTENTPAEDLEVTPGGRPKRRAATVARKYLQALVEELSSHHGKSAQTESQPDKKVTARPTQKPGKVRKRKRRGSDQDSDDATADADFIPEIREEAESEGEPSEDDSLSLDDEDRDARPRAPYQSVKGKYPGWAANGLPNSIMGPIWSCTAATKDFREERYSSWVFPEWIPTAKDWNFLSGREAEKYLPQEETSPAFKISREGLKEVPDLHRIPRFGCLPAHPERWDTVFFVGGPVWSMEWCPCPDGAMAANQYAAVYCNRGMDDRHKIMGTYSEPALLQIWDLSALSYDTCPAAPARLAYALALEDGCIRDMKWCPSGAWELPSTSRKSPLMPRLGLLAAAFSSAKIAIYSLPHPDALLAYRKTQNKGAVDTEQHIYQVHSVAVLKLGSIQADHDGRSGQCLCLDWLPVDPHNILAAGFYDGTVALWNLNTKSVLQRVRSPNGRVVTYPYHCFLAHDSIVRVLCWCRASGDLLVTAGEDRKLKLWDLRKTYEPANTFRRYLSTEVCWPLHYSGVWVAEESCYATYGQHGIHYIDSGYLGFKPFFVAPRKGTVWSMSYSDWLNTCVLSDSTGEMIVVLLPDTSLNPANLKRTSDRRFPVHRAELVPFGSEKEDAEAREEGNGDASNGPIREPQTYGELVKKYCLHFHDMDLRTFKNAQQRPSVKRMLATETKGPMSLDKMPLESLHKVRLNPNLSAQSWVLSAGHAGLVRAHCLRAMHSPIVHKMAQESQAQFAAMFVSQGAAADESVATAVRHSTETVVELL